MMKPSNSAATRRTQAERRAETRAALLAAARDLFTTKGFAETGTPELVKQAGVTRGALYHHFADKTDLFRALAEQEAQEVAAAIAGATQDLSDAQEAMAAGAEAYFDAMAVPGRAKILLADAPSILGHTAARELSGAGGDAELSDGLARAKPDLPKAELDALTHILSAGFERAALEVAEGADKAVYVRALMGLLD